MTTPMKKKKGFNTFLYISTPKFDLDTLNQEEETEDLSDSIEDINLDDDIEELIDDGV